MNFKIDLNKLKPKHIISYIAANRKRLTFQASMLFLCLSLFFTIVFGLLERDGALPLSHTETPVPTATAAPGILSPKDPYYIRMNLGGDAQYLNPVTAADPISKTVLKYILEGLTRLDQSGKAVSGTAESWSSSEDKLIWTFKLRKNAFWNDGKPVTSQDFKTTIDLHLNNESHSPYRTEISSRFAKVECPDDATIVFTLTQPDPQLPHRLSESQYLPVQKAFYESKAFSFGKEATTISYNGPWFLGVWTHGEKMLLLKNETYWNQANIALKQIVILTSGTTESKLENFGKGGYDLVILSAGELPLYTAAEHTVEHALDGSLVYLEMNTKDPILSNSELRKALSLSIDRKAFIDTTLKTGAIAMPGYDITKDLPQAKAHYTTALEALKDTVSPSLQEGLTLMVDQSESSKTFAAALAAQWKGNLGLDVTVEALTYAERIDRIKKGTFQITVNSIQEGSSLPEAPLYKRVTSYATNKRIKNIIMEPGREPDLYYATP